MKNGIEDFQQNYNSYMEEQVQKTYGSIVGSGFKAFQHSGGFNYMTYDGLKYNHLTVECLDSLLKKNDDGNLDLDEGGFSKLYYNVLSSARYTLSNDSQKKANENITKYTAQAGEVIDIYTHSGLKPLEQTEQAAAIVEIYQNCAEEFCGEVTKDCSIIPDSYATLKLALQELNNMAGDSMQTVLDVANKNAVLNLLISNIKNPNKENGGIPVDSTLGYYVGYNKIPKSNELIGSLSTDANSITIKVEGKTLGADSMDVSIDNKCSFAIPIGGLIDIQVNHKSALDINSLKTTNTEFSAEITYSGLSTVPVQPTPSDASGKTGWYDDTDILKDIKNKTNKDEDGYKLIDNRYNVDELFGGDLAHLKTMLISKTPKITVTFKNVNMNYAHSAFKMSNDVSVNLFGFIKLGEHSHSYDTSNVEYNEETQSVTLTFSEPNVSGTPDTNNATAFIMGGVPEYPGMD